MNPATPADSANPRPLKAVFLPPNAWAAEDSDQMLSEPAVNTSLYHLATLGVKWKVITPTPRPWNLLDRGNPFWRGLDPIRALRVLLGQRDADVVISVFEGSGLLVLLLRRLFFFKPKVLLWDASPGNPWRVLQWAQKLGLPRYDGLMMLTRSQKDYLEKHYKLSGPVTCIGYNVDEALFSPATDLSPEDGYVLAVGDDLSRDYPTLLAAAKESTLPFVIKSRWRPDGPVPDNITFISGRLDDNAFRDLYVNAKVVVLPLTPVVSAGGITSLFEAMAMGKPIVLSRSSISDDFITHEHDGVIVQPHDAAALGQAIHKLAADRETRLRLGSNARQRIEQQHSTRQLAVNIRQFIEQMVK